MTHPPIFIAGVPRSGTTLLAAMLCAHSRISCGPETSFFLRLSQARGGRLTRSRAWPDAAVTFLTDMQHAEQSVLEGYGLAAEDVQSYLRDQPPSVAVMLQAITEQYMRRAGKSRWAEKTTSNLLHAREIRRHFPESPIIRIVRDPRDVALSQVNARFGTDTFLEAILQWRDQDEQSDEFFRTDRRCYTIFYEKLLADPAAELRPLCEFMGESFEPGMLNTASAAAHVNRMNEPWKERVGQEVDKSRAGVWARQLSCAENREAEALVGNRLTAYGYPRREEFRRYVAAYPLPAIARYPEMVTRLATDGVRLWACERNELPVASLYVGEPDLDGWLGFHTGTRISRTLSIVGDVLRRRITGRPVVWLQETARATRRGLCARMISRTLTKPTNARTAISMLEYQKN